MKKYLLEIATFTFEGVQQAVNAGADRIELCENPNDGGTTPSYGMLKKIRQHVSIPVFPIIRPRGGDFVYSSIEFDVMKEDLLCCKQLSYEGVVLGILNEDGTVDIARTSALVTLAHPMQVTFHRAFDRTENPLQALEDVIQCGCARILTSGQRPSVYDGMQLVKQLIEQAQNRISIMPGSGLNSKNVKEIATITEATEFHTAARKKYLNETVFSPATMQENLSSIFVDEDEVKAIRTILNEME